MRWCLAGWETWYNDFWNLAFLILEQESLPSQTASGAVQKHFGKQYIHSSAAFKSGAAMGPESCMKSLGTGPENTKAAFSWTVS